MHGAKRIIYALLITHCIPSFAVRVSFNDNTADLFLRFAQEFGMETKKVGESDDDVTYQVVIKKQRSIELEELEPEAYDVSEEEALKRVHEAIGAHFPGLNAQAAAILKEAYALLDEYDKEALSAEMRDYVSGLGVKKSEDFNETDDLTAA